jgi:undecaprenyl-diphosphatase
LFLGREAGDFAGRDRLVEAHAYAVFRVGSLDDVHRDALPPREPARKLGFGERARDRLRGCRVLPGHLRLRMLAHFSKDRWPQPSSVAALVAGLVAWRLPNFDPAAPRVAPPAIRTEVRAHAGLAAFLSSRVDPAAATGLALTLALALVLGGAVAIGALLVMVQHNAGLAHYDLGAARWGATHATSGSTRLLRDVSLLGGTPVMIAVAVIAAAAEYARTRTAAIFGFVTVVVGGQVVVTNVTKILVDRSRPDIHRLTGFSGASFPSGHAACAAATFAAVAFLAGRGRSRRAKALLAAAAAGIAAGVVASRVLLGVHWFTDVLAGLAIGWAWFAIASIAFGGRVLAFGRPVEVATQAAETVDAVQQD